MAAEPAKTYYRWDADPYDGWISCYQFATDAVKFANSAKTGTPVENASLCGATKYRWAFDEYLVGCFCVEATDDKRGAVLHRGRTFDDRFCPEERPTSPTVGGSCVISHYKASSSPTNPNGY